jgi:hypothetical protein
MLRHMSVAILIDEPEIVAEFLQVIRGTTGGLPRRVLAWGHV